MSDTQAKEIVIDESGYMNDAMKKMAEKIFAEEKKPKQQGTVVPINPNTRIIKKGV